NIFIFPIVTVDYICLKNRGERLRASAGSNPGSATSFTCCYERRRSRICDVKADHPRTLRKVSDGPFADLRAMQRKRGRWRWALRFVPGPCHHRRANAALPRRKVALGSSPKAERYWALNRPRCEKPCRKAMVVTLASGPE